MTTATAPPDLDLAPNPALTSVAVYRRTIGASLERVWENVRDWEHLPWLHDRAFAEIAKKGEGDWGWRAEVVYPSPADAPGGGARSNIELLIDAARDRYVTRVIDGPGSGGEIWTRLARRAERETDIEVEFLRDLAPGEDPDGVGQGYVGLYSMLWDEDEAMMQGRQRELDRRARAEDMDAAPIELGRLAELRERLPLDVDAFGSRVRVFESEGELAVHGLVCPHLLGPLDTDAGDPATLVCPWHGYRFSRDSGRSCDGRKLRIACPVELDVAGSEPDAQVRLLAAAR